VRIQLRGVAVPGHASRCLDPYIGCGHFSHQPGSGLSLGHREAADNTPEPTCSA
jgi:hypothetical protein